jgi:SpoVK/Ycf46/Vps4 family AAA+-type ATPase
MNWLQNSQEDNIFAKRNIFVVMTTNHVDNITGPMLRSGRADLVIDIGSFDSASMREAFETCARRMHNRGVSVVGFKTPEDLQKEINNLDMEKLSELAMTKKFTVRDIEMLIIEMAAHRYYYNKHGEGAGIPWTSESFIKVLENSEGSVKGASTGELKLGDRDFYTEDPEDLKVEFEDSVSHVDELKKTTGFKEV